ncbi:substrate-binding domain-containing protein [Roseobacter sp. HKCCA0434]|uniref:substrate-binding domain-containing protein n=1 Tax=Roseobacter sp. HKCCA0434 TaxID=3079297 RepID=UPI002905E09D|nr:substrate-binding domain-containing protein [Roseobacter sp. HKCCA0434]
MKYLIAACLLAAPALADPVLIQSTTSTRNSGLYDAILPEFEAATGIETRVVAVGTGQAIRNATNCDGDLLIVHDRAAEDAFVAAGYGLERHALMYNDFVLIGPEEDPAGIATASGTGDALARIAAAEATFLSRGDDSGTHRKELTLWPDDPRPASGSWYREVGAGMGATLNMAAGMGAYALTDRATWASFGNRQGLALLHEGDPALHNPYAAIAVSPDHCPQANVADARTLIDWLTGADGQAAIGAFAVDGQRLFTPDAD